MEKTLVSNIFNISTMGQYIQYVKDNLVSATRSATCHHMLLLGFAVQSDIQNPRLILLEQMMLPPLMLDREINIPDNNFEFYKNIL